jgi:hypothetical protein
MTKAIGTNICLAGYDGGLVAKLRKHHGGLPSILALIFFAAFLPMELSPQSSPAEGVSTLGYSCPTPRNCLIERSSDGTVIINKVTPGAGVGFETVNILHGEVYSGGFAPY